MAPADKVTGKESTVADVSKATVAAAKTARNRRSFDHVMDDMDRWALDIIRKTKNGLTQVALMIQEGDPIDGEIIDLCSQLQAKCGKLLFH